MPPRSHPRRYWLYGMHAVREALANPAREIHRLLLTPARRDLAPRGIRAEIVETPQIRRLLEPEATHQGAAAEVSPLEAETGEILDRFLAGGGGSTALLLDQVSDPRNVGAVLRSAWAFGISAVLVPGHGAPAESGALAKAASGGLEHVPYLRIGNLAETLARLGKEGVLVIGLDPETPHELSDLLDTERDAPVAIVLGAEGTGLRRLTRERCRELARIPTARNAPSLNVSNAAAVALYAVHTARRNRTAT